MLKRISLRETGRYLLIVGIAIMVFLQLGGRSWMTGLMHGHGNNGSNQKEMESNPE